MCDYSLTSLRSRLAVEGESLVVYLFPTGSLGFTSPDELQSSKAQVPSWRSWFSPREIPCAVCIPHGTRLRLWNVPRRLQAKLGVAASAEVAFVQRSMDVGTHRDGIRVGNNQEIQLQRLAEGLSATVLSLTPQTESQAVVDHWFEGAPA